MSTIDADTYVLSYKGTFNGTCTMDGKSEPNPSPVRAATVWIRNADKWMAAFHGENAIIDPRALPPPPATDKKETPKKDEEKKDDRSAGNRSSAAAPAKPAATRARTL